MYGKSHTAFCTIFERILVIRRHCNIKLIPHFKTIFCTFCPSLSPTIIGTLYEIACVRVHPSGPFKPQLITLCLLRFLQFLAAFFILDPHFSFLNHPYSIYLLSSIPPPMPDSFSVAQFTSSVLLNSFYPLLSLPVSLST